MPLKTLDYSGSGDDFDTVEAIYYATDNGAKIISMSLGAAGTGSPNADGVVCTEIVGLNAALDYAYARGVVVVAAEAALHLNAPVQEHSPQQVQNVGL